MNKIKDALARFMQGRYGSDDLGRFTLIVALILMVITMFTKWNLFYLLALALLVYSYFRMLSRNTWKRSEENQKFLSLKNNFTNVFNREKNHAAQRKDYRFFKCPTCKQTVRVPRGKGKIKIHCPKCNTDFIKKS